MIGPSIEAGTTSPLGTAGRDCRFVTGSAPHRYRRGADFLMQIVIVCSSPPFPRIFTSQEVAVTKRSGEPGVLIAVRGVDFLSSYDGDTFGVSWVFWRFLPA